MDKQKAIVKVEKSIAGGNQEISSKGLEKKNSYPQEMRAKQIKEINPSSYPPEVKSHSAENVVKADVPKERKTTQLKEMRHDLLYTKSSVGRGTEITGNIVIKSAFQLHLFCKAKSCHYSLKKSLISVQAAITVTVERNHRSSSVDCELGVKNVIIIKKCTVILILFVHYLSAHGLINQLLSIL